MMFHVTAMLIYLNLENKNNQPNLYITVKCIVFSGQTEDGEMISSILQHL